MTNQAGMQQNANEPKKGTGAVKWLIIGVVCLIVTIISAGVAESAPTKGGNLFWGIVNVVAAFGSVGFLITSVVVFFRNRRRRSA